MNRKMMTSLKISKDINNQMLHGVIEKNYGLRGKSKWIIEAIEQFLDLEDYPELVDIATEMQDLTETISIRLPAEIIRKLDKAVIVVRTRYPALEGVKSNIIRASIMQRLLRD